MKLNQKQEEICQELGDRAGLSRSYCNQAEILKDWGQLDEAMKLNQKKKRFVRSWEIERDLQFAIGIWGNYIKNRNNIPKRSKNFDRP